MKVINLLQTLLGMLSIPVATIKILLIQEIMTRWHITVVSQVSCLNEMKRYIDQPTCYTYENTRSTKVPKSSTHPSNHSICRVHSVPDKELFLEKKVLSVTVLSVKCMVFLGKYQNNLDYQILKISISRPDSRNN